MRVLSRIEADHLLLALGLKIGNWNELADDSEGVVTSKGYRPPRNALELYVVARQLLNWIAGGEWTFLQVDNSTAPANDEIRVFEKLMFHGEERWDIGAQRSFLLDDASKVGSATDQTSLVLLIFFSLVFEWHVYLTSKNSTRGQRLALQDGVVYFFGDAKTIERADTLVSRIAESPLHLSQ
jgi:hypothetical protein